MKLLALFATASFCANVVLIGTIAGRSGSTAPDVSAARAPQPYSAKRPAAVEDAALRAAMESGDIAALEAAGLPPEVARHVSLSRAFLRFQRANQDAADTGGKWWGASSSGAGRSRDQLLAARRQFSEAIVAAFGEDFGVGGPESAASSFLAPAKRTALRRILQDYEEMFAAYGTGGLQLPSDKEKLRLLRAERDRDIAALLTADERLAYEMRTSPTAAIVRSRYGDAIQSEQEFQQIYSLQKAFEDKYPRDAMSGRISAETLRVRADAERQLENEIRAAVGDERYTALRRSADPDLRTVDALVARLSLPPSTTDAIAAARDSFATQAQRINSDASVPLAQRRSQIQELSARAKNELNRTLGAEAAEAYAQRSPWINMLQNGMAYSTTPLSGSPAPAFAGSQSVYAVPPAGGPGAAPIRQVIVNGIPASTDGLGGPSDTFGGGNVQVMTFSTSAGGPPDPAATGVRKEVMVVPGSGPTVVPPGK